ncbi:MAG TPA: hypothetical protein ENI64_05880 [Gammaproteobacteria bacterium]|nr:hypothetical protein [Gammaproteobacteria bacterium]
MSASVDTYKALTFSLFISIAPAYVESGKIAEFTDKDYGYAFQYPSEWKPSKLPKTGEGDGVRFILRTPKGVTLIVTAGSMGSSVTKEAFERNSKKNDLLNKMFDFTIETVYLKTSKDVGAANMVILQKEVLPSVGGIKLYISTLNHFPKGHKVAVSGITVIPFSKKTIVSFIMIAPVNPALKEEAAVLDKIFSSFHLIGELPTVSL